MKSHIIVPEGLAATDSYPEETFYLSDYFEAVLQAVLKVASLTDVIITPGNSFGYPQSEEEYAKRYLQHKQPKFNIITLSKTKDSSYLDTFDNARLLYQYLQQQPLVITEPFFYIVMHPIAFGVGLCFVYVASIFSKS